MVAARLEVNQALYSGYRALSVMVEDVPIEENYPEPQKAWVRIFKRGAGWSLGLASLPERAGEGSTGTARARFSLGKLGKERGEVARAGTEVGVGTGAISEEGTWAEAGALFGARSGARLGTSVRAGAEAESVESLCKKGGMRRGEVVGRGKRRQTEGTWSPIRRLGEKEREEGREETRKKGREEGREEGREVIGRRGDEWRMGRGKEWWKRYSK